MNIHEIPGSKIVAETLIELADKYPVAVISADSLGGMGGAEFKAAHPDRFVECGIAEANMMSVAAGMNAMGWIPVAHTHTPFVTRRCFDQIVISVAYSGLCCKILGSSPGIYSQQNGGTHLSIEDVSIMRSVPRFKVIDPCDAVSIKKLLPLAVLDEAPVYFRFNRGLSTPIYNEDAVFELGRANTVKEGGDCTIIASDIMVSWSLEASELLKKDGIDVTVIDMHTIKPIDRDAVIKAAERGPIVTAENGSVINGLGSAVAEVIAESGRACRFKRVGIQDRFGVVGSLKSIGEELSMRPENIADAVRSVLG